ncbi:MAG TPA: YebC/PmpR family DNA-binding transcriptional regulator [Desulfurella acetivorans]|uniref:Probable transcriptional regulatory protein ENM99_05365 n=1 Tax=Desulfurella acetivorans TaxID=33002 RepID=A0A7C6A802_DESAE|nr:YebC/PmpR family DNA-binding transcriptional regulator [Desulfurella acetivorans]
MSGHNKWSTIKHKKAKEDSKRGAVFTKIIKELTIAARLGGKDPESNPRLRLAIDRAKEANMPKQNIEKAILKGAGELSGVSYEEVLYEGYGPFGVAMVIKATTDNRQRTTSSVRHILSKHGGSLGEVGCVSWMFDNIGFISLKSDKSEEEMLEIALELGVKDVKYNSEDNVYEIITEPKDLMNIKTQLENNGFNIETAELTLLPQTTVKLDKEQAKSMIKLMDALEEDDDVSNVYANFDIPNEILEELE